MSKTKNKKKQKNPPARSQSENPKQDNIVTREIYAQFQGPIPPPETLEGYERIESGFANRILSMAEWEGSHRREMEKKAIELDRYLIHSEYKLKRWGQIFGFVIGIFALSCGTYMVINGHPISGSAIGTGGVVGLVTAFIYGRRTSESNED